MFSISFECQILFSILLRLLTKYHYHKKFKLNYIFNYLNIKYLTPPI